MNQLNNKVALRKSLPTTSLVSTSLLPGYQLLLSLTEISSGGQYCVSNAYKVEQYVACSCKLSDWNGRPKDGGGI